MTPQRKNLTNLRGYHALVQVLYELQQGGQYSDEEGEETAALAELLHAIEGALPGLPTAAPLPGELPDVEKIMEQVQVFASAWSLVGSRFDAGDQLETAEAEKQALRTMIGSALSAQKDRLLEALERAGAAESEVRRLLDAAALSAAQPAQPDRDAERYRQLRRGQRWSVIDGIGDTLRAEALDAAIDSAAPAQPAQEGRHE